MHTNTKSKMNVLPLLLLSLLTLVFPSAAQQPVSGPVPAVQLDYPAQRTMLSDPTSHKYPVPGTSIPLHARAKVHSVGDRIGILWTLVDYSTDLRAKPEDSQYTKYAVGYQVTSIEFRADGKLLVAGASRSSGRATIELWTFSEPSVSSESELKCGRLASRSLLFSAPANANFGHITWISSGGALGQNEVLLMTYPSYTVYRFDCDSVSASPLVSATATVASRGPVAELGSWWDHSYYGGRHVDFGHCFFLKKQTRVNVNDHDVVGCVLCDGNLDGNIDNVIVLYTKEDYASYELTSPAKWL
jgi:hypothetical protein